MKFRDRFVTTVARNAGPGSSSSGYGLRMESVGIYEYSTKDLIGHGAFAVVYRGRLKMVSYLSR